jgi:uncharacterized protein (DUF427 family)
LSRRQRHPILDRGGAGIAFSKDRRLMEDPSMRATLEGQVVAESDDIVEAAGYRYFPRAAVRMEWLEKAPRTDDDLECPHGVQFYDVVIDGRRHARAAWSYEDPRPAMRPVAGRFGFWEDVEVR